MRILGGIVLVWAIGCSSDAAHRDGPDASGPARVDAAPVDRPQRPDARPRPDATPLPDAFVPYTLRVEALIDGRSRLTLRGTTAQWHHFDRAAPGLHDGANAPTVIGEAQWVPVWPSQGENRDCNCDSDVFDGVAPMLPGGIFEVEMVPIAVRAGAQIVESPSPENNFAVVLELNDNGPGGSSTYVVDLEIGQPSSL